MIEEFYRKQKLHLLEDSSVEMEVHRVEEDAVVMLVWIDDYKHVLQRYSDLEKTKKLLGKGWREVVTSYEKKSWEYGKEIVEIANSIKSNLFEGNYNDAGLYNVQLKEVAEKLDKLIQSKLL